MLLKIYIVKWQSCNAHSDCLYLSVYLRLTFANLVIVFFLICSLTSALFVYVVCARLWSCIFLPSYTSVWCAGSKDHIKVQGEILEGLVARIVKRESSEHMERVLKDFPPPPLEGGKLIISYMVSPNSVPIFIGVLDVLFVYLNEVVRKLFC